MNRSALAAVLLFLAAGATHAGDTALGGWRSTFDALLAQSGQQQTAFDFLQRQPMEVKSTAAWHIALARAARAIDSALWGSRAVMVLTLFLKPDPPPDLAETKQWLGAKGLKHHQLALDALGRGDEAGAAKEYLVAVRCDQSVLGFADARLRERSLTVMDGLVRAHSDDPSYWGHLAFYSYFYGHLDVARDALVRGLAIQKDPYLRWVYEQGLLLVDRESHAPSNPAPAPAPAAPAPDPVATSYAKARREQIEAELARVERVMASTDLAPASHREPAASAPPPSPSPACPLPGARQLKDQLTADLRSALLETSGFHVGY